MNRSSLTRRISFNAPVILTFTFVSLLVVIISFFSRGRFADFLATYFTSWKDPMMYLRLITHIVAHADFSHFTSNFMMILVIGPLVEEKYGSVSLLLMTLITAVITGLLHMLLAAVFSQNTALMGASGIVFMLILLASFANMKEGTIPLTVILVAVLYLGNELITGILSRDSISQMAHIVGGLCGAGFGYLSHKNKSVR